jgi:putative endonuclease
VERPPHLAFVLAATPFRRDTEPAMSRHIDQAYVYILASSFQHLYIGITTQIEIRVSQHKNGAYPESFTSRYKIDKLVYLERYAMVSQAIAREKQLKRWSRIKKLRLIVAQNPTWKDLSEDWGKPITPYIEK